MDYVRVEAQGHEGLFVGQVDPGGQLRACQLLGITALPRQVGFPGRQLLLLLVPSSTCHDKLLDSKFFQLTKFSSLDLQCGCHQICIVEQYVPKTAVRTLIQSTVLSFGLTHAPAAF